MKKSAKGKGKGKKTLSRIPIVHFGPSPVGPAPLVQRVAHTKLTIDDTGALDPPPTLIDVNTGDSVSWLVVNNSDKQVHIKNKKFKKGSADVSPISFITERVTVPKNGGTATIFGTVTHLPAGESDQIKYTVEVRGKHNADYDPDLIIRRPPV